MKVRVLDIEANGLRATVIHCFVFRSLDNKHVEKFRPWELKEAIEFLSTVDVVIGHNIISYDLPTIERLLGFKYTGKVVDTLLMSRMLNPRRMLPPEAKDRRAGPHGLYAWGVRVGVDKPEIHEWSEYNEDILHRCVEDTEINVKTYHMLMKEAAGGDWNGAFKMTFKLFQILQKQEEYGWKVDVDYMKQCIQSLDNRFRRIDAAITPRLPNVLDILEVKKGGEYGWVKKPFLKNGQISKHIESYFGSVACDLVGPFSRVSFRKVNIGSGDETKSYLLSLGWEPLEWNTNDSGERTSPKMSKDDPFEGITSGVGKLIARRVQYRHRRSLLEGLLLLVRDDGAIPSVVAGLTDTFRAVHRNIVNIPAAKSLFGAQMRKCFVARKGMVIVSTDSDSCQLRMLGGRIKSKKYIEAITTGDKSKGTDLHSLTKTIGELDNRDIAKNTMYCLLFGGGDGKLGKTAKKVGQGAELRRKLYKGFDGLDEHMKELTEQWKKTAVRKYNPVRRQLELVNGTIIGLDGRPVVVPYQHQLLVYELQSDEAIMMSAAYIKTYTELERRGLKHGVDWGYVCFYHDEYSIETYPQHAELVRKVSEESISWAGKFFNIVCPHKGDGKIGGNWYEIH